MSRQPSSFDQIYIYPDEAALGFATATTLDSIIEAIGGYPFEASLLTLARLSGALRAVHRDPVASLALARELLAGDDDLYERLAAFFAQHDRPELTSEQHVHVLMRIVLESARDVTLSEEGGSGHEVAGLFIAAIAAGTPLHEASRETTDRNHEIGDWLAYFVQQGAYGHLPSPLGEISRAEHLYADILNRPGTRALKTYCDLDEWHLEDYGLRPIEQLEVGFALSAVAGAWDDDVAEVRSKRHVSHETLEDVLGRLGLGDRKDAVLSLVSGDRTWFNTTFGPMDSKIDHVMWETRPFYRRPFVRFNDGGLVLTGSRFLQSWMTDGLHYRSLDSAQKRNPKKSGKVSRGYTSFHGEITETYVFELVRDSHGDRPAGGGRVWPEQRYGKGGGSKTSDVIVDAGPDLVLIEVSASRLAGDQSLLGDTEQVIAQLDRLVLSKVKQLSGCIDALVAGTATVPSHAPEIDMTIVKRIWPIVVSAGSLMHTEVLWDYIDGTRGHHLTQARVQPLTLLDMEDLESLCGWVEGGHPLVSMLSSHAEPGWAKLELARWASEHPRAPRKRNRPSTVKRGWDAVSHRVARSIEAGEVPE